MMSGKNKSENCLLSSLDSVNRAISIYDNDGMLLYGNKYFYNYLYITDTESCIGQKIDDILRKAGTSVQAINSSSARLKMMDVLESGKEVIDWEVRVISAKGDTQIVGNDMFPVFGKNGEISGMVEITHSRQQTLSQTRKMAGLYAEYTFDNIIGNSKCIRDCIEIAKDYADSPLSLLITGESGVGKELFAQSVHNYSSRRKGPFVALNCASFPENLIESELFGYVSGAFTGASKHGQIGKFELADGGTLFLDEIGELPYHFQPKLLRVLETWRITRIGSTKEFPVNVRIIAATNKNLAQMVEEGLFRQDLYYRLQILNVNIPPLRNRENDIILIAEALLNQIKDPNTTNKKMLTDNAKNMLLSHDWPGNVRELRNVLYRAALLSKTPYIGEDVIRTSISATSQIPVIQAPKSEVGDSITSMPAEDRLELRRSQLDEANANLIKEALSIADGNKTKAAELLNMSRNTFYRMIKKYDI